MKKIEFLLPILFFFVFTSCSRDDEILNADTKDEITEAEILEVKEFIYAGMNEIYLYKADVPALADDYFTSSTDKKDFLKGFDSPKDLYDGLQSSQDRFSFMTDDYVALEKNFSGISTTSGIQYGLGLISGSSDVFGYVRYVLPETSAAEKGIERGDVFTEVNGQQLTQSNYSELLAENKMTINLGTITGNTINMTNETVTLAQMEYSENPVFIAKTINLEGHKVGYLMYNSFTADFDDKLNDAFAYFKSENISDLVLDLRYNGGGSVATAVGLAGMITGQFNGEIFLKEHWNEKYQNAWDPESYISRFSDKITLNRGTDSETDIALNSLGLSKVYILTTGSTASASELIINGLDPYIDVVQVGKTTTGKFQASTTLYDSPNFARKNANPNHTYAIQPLIFKSANADGVSDYVKGLKPDIKIDEDLANLGVLGDPSEPLLKAALNDILGIPQDQENIAAAKRAESNFKIIGESGMNQPGYQEMYVDKISPIPETK